LSSPTLHGFPAAGEGPSAPVHDAPHRDRGPGPRPAGFRGNYIGGRWVEAVSGRRLPSTDPANGDVLGEVAESGPEDVERAVEAARRAFDAWRRTPAPRRGEILFRAAETLVRRKDELARLMAREMGKVLAESRGDVQEGIDMTYYMAGEGRRLIGQTVPCELPDKFGCAVREPVGVVAAITPWNFPLAIPTWKLMPALVAGNTVVFKPASDTPLLAAELVHVLEEAGLPPGVLNLVFGPGDSVGQALARHPGVSLVSFTGSTEAGRQVNRWAGEGLKRVHLEMGGKNAVIVLEDADLELAAEGILWSAFGTTGQRCTAASRVIAHRAVERELAERLVERAERLRLGHGLDPRTDVGPLINRRALEKMAFYAEVGRREGARLLCGGRVADEGELARGNFYRPTVWGDVRPDMRIAQEEIFGPVTAILPAGSLEEAVAINNHTGYGLSTSVYTRDVNRAFRALREISTGLVYVNAGTIGAEIQLPFGGTRGTGNGHREAGTAALEVYSEWKTIYVDYSGRLQRAQMDPVEAYAARL
jgi:acyl-CoA reductase-like NAD-dependent aldehyde dehydrogenase